MRICKKLWFLISVLVFVFSFSFCSYAITPLSSITKQTFEDGPWAGQSIALGRVNSDGSITNYGVPSWRDGSSSGDAYYKSVGSYNVGVDGYFFSGDSVNNVVIWSYGPLDQLFVVDSNGIVVADVLEDAFLVNPSSSRYFYGVSVSGGAGVAFSSSAMVYLTELSTAFNGGSYYEQIADAMPYMDGIYDGNSIAVKYPGMSFDWVLPYSVSYGFSYYYFPVVCTGLGDENDGLTFNFNTSDAVLHSDSVYNLYWKVYNFSHGWWDVGSNGVAANVSGNTFHCQISGFESVLSSVRVTFIRSSLSVPDALCFFYSTSSSDDIGALPPDDSGDGEGSGSPDYSSALSQIGARLDQVMAAVSEGSQQIVNNITYQTTQITNTITNTVTNMTQQITQGLSDVKQGITDKLQGVQEGLSNKLEDVKSGVNEKLGQVQESINNKLGEVQEELVNGYDNSGINQDAAELDSSLKEYDEAEQNVLDNVNDSLNDFEFDAGFDDYKTIIQTVSDFLQALYDASGGLKVLINLSMLMSIAGIVIGVYRIRGGG